MLRMTRITLTAEDAGSHPRPVAPDPAVIARLLLQEPACEALPGGGTRYTFTLEESGLETLRGGDQAALLERLEEIQALERRLAIADAPGPARLLRAAAQALLAEALARKLAT